MRNHGMTLLELLVVLAILALMATAAVTSTDVLLSQGRYEATTRTLANIQDSVLGPPIARQADGTLISTGFVADLGGAGLHRHRLDRAFGALGVARRGRAVRLASDERSGRGGSLRLARPLSALAGRTKRSSRRLGQPIRSARFQRQSGGPGRNDRYGSKQRFRQQRAIQRALGQHSAAPDRGRRICLCADSSGSISNPPSGSQVYVSLFGPNPSTGGVQELPLTVTTGTDGVVSFAMPSGTAVYAPGFLRAYLGGSTSAAATSRSNIVQFVRSEAGITLYLSSSGT